MALKITIAAPTPVAHVNSSGTHWLTLLVPYLVGAATALAVQMVIQFYVVPRVETRKRREDRWERNVLDLGELLNTRLTSLAEDLHAAQLIFRAVRDEQSDEYDPALVARQAREAEQATWAYGGLIGTQVDWLIGRIVSLSPNAREIAQLQRVAQNYRARSILVRPLPDHDNRTDTEFAETWEKERAACEALINQVKLLADLPHPPRASWYRQNVGRARDWPGPFGGPDPLR